MAPGHVQVLSADPYVVKVPHFVSPVEAWRMVELAAGLFKQSTVVCNVGDGRCIDPSRTSWSAYLGNTDPIVEAVRERARRWSGFQNAEPAQVVRYKTGQEFKPHLDALDPKTPEGQREIAKGGGQRTATFLVYLNDVPHGAGGETVFPPLGLRVQPEAGAAIYWLHHRRDGRLDDRVLHGGAPLLGDGLKYAANLWLRGGPRRP